MYTESLNLFADENKMAGEAATIVDCLRVQKNLASIE